MTPAAFFVRFPRARGGAGRSRGCRRRPARRIKEKQGGCCQPPLLKFHTRVRFQRTSTRQQLDCAETLLLCSQENRRIPTSDGLSTCSRSNPRLHRRGQEFDRDPTRPSPNIRGSSFQGQQHRSARAIQLHNEYAIDLTCHARMDVMRERGPRLFQVRVIHEDVCRTDGMQLHIQLC